MPDLRVGVLGTLEVHVDGRPQVVPPGRQRAVLTCLLAHAGQPVSRDALIEAAWRDDVPHNPPKALRTVLSRLRTVLGPQSIEFTPAGYRLSFATVDGDEFVDLVRRARSTDPLEASDLLERGLALWRGPAYGEYADAPYATAVAQSLEQLRMEAVEARADALLQLGHPAAAITALQELLVDQPFREHALEVLATALYHAGRQTDALDLLRNHRKTLAAELGLDPAPGLADLEAAILGHTMKSPRAVEAPPAWLDTSTAFVGREDELSDVAASVVANRLSMITGPGGVGKSRLAAEALPRIHRELGLPTTVVELAQVGAHQAIAAVADRIGLRSTSEHDRDHPGRPAADCDSTRPDLTSAAVVGELVAYLEAVPHLLVLDNCEHVLPEIATLASTIARRCPGTRVLATSRHRLGVPTERVLPLTPLRLPDPATSAGRQEATSSMRLFIDRVRRLRPTFTLTPDNRAQVVDLCRWCDGVPLALEITASRVASTSVADVVEFLPGDLTRSDLHAVVDWSYRLLGAPERLVLQCLSVCAGDLDGPSILGLIEHLGEDGQDLSGALGELVESSLVVRVDVEGGTTGPATVRYRLLAMVRAYAAERLADSGRAADVHRAHAHWVRTVLEGVQQDWSREDGARLSARLTAHAPEIGSALRWALDADDFELAAGLSHTLVRCWHWTPSPPVRDLMAAVAETATRYPGPTTAPGLAAGAFIAAEHGEVARAAELAKEALVVSDAGEVHTTAYLALAVAAMYAADLRGAQRHFTQVARNPETAGEAHASLALTACYADDLTAAREHAAIALTACSAGSDHALAFAQYAAGEVRARTDPDAGMSLLRQAIAEAERVSAEQVARVARIALFARLVRDGASDEAVPLGLILITDLRRLSAWNQIWTLLRLLAELLAANGRWSDAAFLWGAAAAGGAPPPMGDDVERYAQLEALLATHLEAGFRCRIEDLAAATPRHRVLSRAEDLLARWHRAGRSEPPASDAR